METKAAGTTNCNMVGSCVVKKFEKGAEEEKQFIFRRTNRVARLKSKIMNFMGKMTWSPVS